MIEKLLNELPTVIRIDNKWWLLKITKLIIWGWRVAYVSWFWDDIVLVEWELEESLTRMLDFTKNLQESKR